MKKNNDVKKLVLLLATYFAIVIVPKIKATNDTGTIKYHNDYNKESLCYAEYDDRYVYIGNEEELTINENDNNIYIIDQRDSKDPNMSIHNSYKIEDKEEIKKILKIIEEYNKEYPSRWIRTFDSMKNEWIIHNMCFELSIRQTNSQNVDLNNEDESKYDNNFLTFILK